MTKRVNIFTPVYHRFQKTRLALDSIIESIEQSENDVYLYIGVNGIENDEMRDWLAQMGFHDKVRVFMAEKNIGKAHIINYMHERVESSDYFISVDSDMVAHENDKYNWIDELVKLMEWQPAENFALFSTWQDEYNAHLLDKQDKRTEFIGHEIWYGTFWGVAGGCVIMRNSDFIKIGRYTIYDVYSGDDAFLMRKISEQMKKLVGITATIKLKHQANLPEEEAYQQWKVMKCQGKLPVGANTKGFYD